MQDELFAFQWAVYEGGHKWENIRSGPYEPWVLRGIVVPGHDWPETFYNPLESFPALHIIFANIDASDRDSILEFANLYGMLGLNHPRPGGGAFTTPSESHEHWKNEVWDMRQAVDLREMVRVGDVVGLNKFFSWNESGGCIYKNKCPWNTKPIDEIVPQRGISLLEGDVLMAARVRYAILANKKLRGESSAQLRIDPIAGREVVQVIPRTLLAALWLQFIRGVEGNHLYPKCKECQRPFAVSPEERGNRRSRKFCSDACKAKNYRARKAAALVAKKRKGR